MPFKTSQLFDEKIRESFFWAESSGLSYFYINSNNELHGWWDDMIEGRSVGTNEQNRPGQRGRDKDLDLFSVGVQCIVVVPLYTTLRELTNRTLKIEHHLANSVETVMN